MTTGIRAIELRLAPHSVVSTPGTDYGLTDTDGKKRLAVLADLNSASLDGFEGEHSEVNGGRLLLGPLSPGNAAALRGRIAWLQPRLWGTRTSAGLGDRLGLATPGHVRAMRAAGGSIGPIFAQQSMREMARTGRTPQQVMDDATWGVFQEGWREGIGADADHLKIPADIDACLSAGFTFFTIDPGEFVDGSAETADLSRLRELAAKLPADAQPRATGLLGRSIDVEGRTLHFDEPALLKAAAKYGQAVEHVAAMSRHLAQAAAGRPWELEVSVDETEQPTSAVEHVYIANELRRLGVEWVSLAPRFIGRFEKGVEYIGDPAAFETDLAVHAAIARQFGPYKLSLHSGSDKFSIYPAAMRQTRGLVHLKTAGTSYLEGLRTIASIDPEFFLAIYTFARERYEIDRKSYHVSAQLERAPLPEAVTDPPGLLNQFDAREILHVTFGSVLTAQAPGGGGQFSDRLWDILQAHADLYAVNLEAHFLRHLKPFSSNGVR
jgi:tagaturonate epimerase